MLNEHAKLSHSTCKKCKKHFEIRQQKHSADSSYRLCYIPYSCGEKYCPDKAKSAIPLQSYEYVPNHPGYRPLEDDQEEEEEMDSSSYASPEAAAIPDDQHLEEEQYLLYSSNTKNVTAPLYSPS